MPRKYGMTFEAKKFRDIHWCHNLNEPIILTYNHKDQTACCAHCNAAWDWNEPNDPNEDHPFICHINSWIE